MDYDESSPQDRLATDLKMLICKISATNSVSLNAARLLLHQMIALLDEDLNTEAMLNLKRECLASNTWTTKFERYVVVNERTCIVVSEIAGTHKPRDLFDAMKARNKHVKFGFDTLSKKKSLHIKTQISESSEDEQPTLNLKSSFRSPSLLKQQKETLSLADLHRIYSFMLSGADEKVIVLNETCLLVAAQIFSLVSTVVERYVVVQQKHFQKNVEAIAIRLLIDFNHTSLDDELTASCMSQLNTADKQLMFALNEDTFFFKGGSARPNAVKRNSKGDVVGVALFTHVSTSIPNTAGRFYQRLYCCMEVCRAAVGYVVMVDKTQDGTNEFHCKSLSSDVFKGSSKTLTDKVDFRKENQKGFVKLLLAYEQEVNSSSLKKLMAHV